MRRLNDSSLLESLSFLSLLLVVGCCRPPTPAAPLVVDSSAGPASDGNGVFEPNETVSIQPSWHGDTRISGRGGVRCAPVRLIGVASSFTGPAGPVYTIVDGAANYGTIPINGTHSCASTGNCFSMSVTLPATRPSTHWDATFTETVGIGPASLFDGGFSWSAGFADAPNATDAAKGWTLHIGDSFTDVPRTNPFYKKIETLLHHGLTVANGVFIPGGTVSRGQMAVLLLKAQHGKDYIPPAATGIFADVPVSSPFAPFVEQLLHEGITGGCGSGNYCPGSPVTRAQMAVFLLVAEQGTSYTPPPATGIFGDVPVSSGFAPWIEQLFHEGITGGCGGSDYCPGSPVTRGQMAVFLTETFHLKLYGL